MFINVDLLYFGSKGYKESCVRALQEVRTSIVGIEDGQGVLFGIPISVTVKL